MVEINKAEPVPPLWFVLAKLAEGLRTEPGRVVEQAREVLKRFPAQAHVLQLLVCAQSAQGGTASTRTMLEGLAAEWPNVAAVHYELGLLLGQLGEPQAAAGALFRVVELEPEHPTAWRALGDQLAAAGDAAGAKDAYLRFFKLSVTDVLMLEHVMALPADQIQSAGTMLREFLTIYPTDVAVIRMLGEIYMRVGQLEAAEAMFARALELAPQFLAARRDYAASLHHQLRWDEECQQLDCLLEADPESPQYRYLKATALFRIGWVSELVAYCEQLLHEEPGNASYWMAYAYALRAAGRPQDCIAALRQVIRIEPGHGEAWWGLASLKTFRFEPADIAAMRRELARSDLSDESLGQLHFALAAAFEANEDYAQSFEQYRCGNRLRRAGSSYSADDFTQSMRRDKARYTRAFFDAVAGKGCEAQDPIFVVGLPRSGSTLVEQILSSHSSVEGAGELGALTAIASRLEAKADIRRESATSEFEAPLLDQDLRFLGEDYLKRTRPFRSLARPYFVDKMPKNFHHLGLICAILPNAKIIDVRRHPLACGLSIYKQIFASGMGPFYDLSDIGRYYADYVGLTAHFDEVLPGRVHRVIYEDLVRNPEEEVRRLLRYCGLPFEEQCLRFHEFARKVLTVSSEQVRRPLYADAIEHWRHYDRWLGPLKAALGQVLDDYPASPARHKMVEFGS